MERAVIFDVASEGVTIHVFVRGTNQLPSRSFVVGDVGLDLLVVLIKLILVSSLFA
jgi:hypothetical protein